jgi:hypothetical protein
MQSNPCGHPWPHKADSLFREEVAMKKAIGLVAAWIGVLVLTSCGAWPLRRESDLEKAESYVAQQRWDAAKETYQKVLSKLNFCKLR